MHTIMYLSFLFGISELALTVFKHSRSGTVRIKSDRGSLVILWILMLVSITAGFFAAFYGNWTTINYILASAGVFLYVAGMVIRWRSIIQLRHRFTVNVVVNKEHRLETEGMYKYLRHPSYSGILLILAGLGLAMNSYISFAVVIIPVFLGLSYRIKVEEKLLETEFGEEYVEFCTRRKRLIPFLY